MNTSTKEAPTQTVSTSPQERTFTAHEVRLAILRELQLFGKAGATLSELARATGIPQGIVRNQLRACVRLEAARVLDTQRRTPRAGFAWVWAVTSTGRRLAPMGAAS